MVGLAPGLGSVSGSDVYIYRRILTTQFHSESHEHTEKKEHILNS